MVYFDAALKVNNAFILPLMGVSRKSVDNVQIFFIVNLGFFKFHDYIPFSIIFLTNQSLRGKIIIYVG